MDNMENNSSDEMFDENIGGVPESEQEPLEQETEQEEQKPQEETEPVKEPVKPAQAEPKAVEQKPGKDATHAQRRREQEQQFKQILEKERSESYQKGKLEALVGLKNHFTDEVIADEDDAKVYLKYVECEKAGFDPLAEMHKYEKQLIVKQREESSKSMSQEEWFKNDKQMFEKEHPDVSIEKLSQDALFKDFASDKIGKRPLAEIYKDFQFIEKQIALRSEAEVKNKESKKASSPGPLNTAPQSSKVDYNSMSDEDFDKVLASAKRGDLKK